MHLSIKEWRATYYGSFLGKDAQAEDDLNMMLLSVLEVVSL